MKRIILGSILSVSVCISYAQSIEKIIDKSEVERIERVLAADDMRGRKTFTPDIDRAADFIGKEFENAGLKKLPGATSFRQEFSLLRTKESTVSGTWDGSAVDAKNFQVVSNLRHVVINPSAGYEKAWIKTGDNLQTEARKLLRNNKNRIVYVEKSFANSFGNLARLRSSMFNVTATTIFVLSDTEVDNFELTVDQDFTEMKMANVVGILPGKSPTLGKEIVVFSGHYDHLGVTTNKSVNNDSIFNGANDDAAGTTAVIMLARYFAKMKNNERTIIFAAFTAEEIGGFGSQYFSRQLDADKVVAMFNIEMIGTESKWGTNSAYITGYEKTNMGEILARDLEGTGFTFYPDPYPSQQLFYRSDNATLARLGVPAHTISTSKMDSEPNYHKLSDEVETLDLDNMTRIIKAIALSSKSIVAGKETPTRVKVEELR